MTKRGGTPRNDGKGRSLHKTARWLVTQNHWVSLSLWAPKVCHCESHVSGSKQSPWEQFPGRLSLRGRVSVRSNLCPLKTNHMAIPGVLNKRLLRRACGTPRNDRKRGHCPCVAIMRGTEARECPEGSLLGAHDATSKIN